MKPFALVLILASVFGVVVFAAFRKLRGRLTTETAAVSDVLPLVPLSRATLFPGLVLTTSIRSPPTLALMRNAFERGTPIGAVTQRDPDEETPRTAERLFTIGTVARIIGLEKTGTGGFTVVLRGSNRFRVKELTANTTYMSARTEVLSDESTKPSVVFDQNVAALRMLIRDVMASMPDLASGTSDRLNAVSDPGELAYLVAAHLDLLATNLDVFGGAPEIPNDEKQAVLEAVQPEMRVALVVKLMRRLRQISVLSKSIEAANAAEEPKTRELHLRLVARVTEQMMTQDCDDLAYLNYFLTGIRAELNSHAATPESRPKP